MASEQVIEEVKQQIAKVLGPLPDYSRANVLRLLHEKLADDEKKAADARGRVAALEDIRDWLDAKPPYVLERNDCSRLHKLKEAMLSGKVIDSTKDELAFPPSDSLSCVAQTFVVRHDWANAFEGAEGISDEFRLPYQICTFEFRVVGRTVIVFAGEDDQGISGSKRVATPFVESGDYWYCPGYADSNQNELLMYLWAQIRSICIALDAEVATTTVVRAPHKLNEKRERQGKPLIIEHRVVDLAKRHRVGNPSAGQGTGSKKRLHFRRGHWRHYEESKTWVRWCLVGDPDLGFISKHYQL
jgi:hypothetical protein